MSPYHMCSEECFCEVLSSNLLEQLEVEAPYANEGDTEFNQEFNQGFDQELISRMDEWWDSLEELGGES